MKQKVKISTHLFTHGMAGNKDEVTEEFEGWLEKEGDTIRLSYHEPENNGPTVTEITASEVHITRNGNVNYCLELHQDEDRPFVMRMENNELPMMLHTHEVAVNHQIRMGEAKVHYEMCVQEVCLCENKLTFSWVCIDD